MTNDTLTSGKRSITMENPFFNGKANCFNSQLLNYQMVVEKTAKSREYSASSMALGNVTMESHEKATHVRRAIHSDRYGVLI